MSILKLFDIFYCTYLILWFIIRTSFEPYLEPGGKNAPFVFFFKYLQNEKGMTLPFYDFSYYLFWTFLPNFLRKFWLAHELLWFCQRGTEKFKKKKCFFKFFIYLFIFFLKQLFLQNISSIHYVEVVNKIFFIWNHIFLLVFENK